MSPKTVEKNEQLNWSADDAARKRSKFMQARTMKESPPLYGHSAVSGERKFSKKWISSLCWILEVGTGVSHDAFRIFNRINCETCG